MYVCSSKAVTKYQWKKYYYLLVQTNMIFKLNDAFVVAFEHCHKKLQTAQAGSRNVSTNDDSWVNYRTLLSCWRIKPVLIFRQNIVVFFDCHIDSSDANKSIKDRKLLSSTSALQRVIMTFGLIQSITSRYFLTRAKAKKINQHKQAKSRQERL